MKQESEVTLFSLSFTVSLISAVIQFLIYEIRLNVGKNNFEWSSLVFKIIIGPVNMHLEYVG